MKESRQQSKSGPIKDEHYKLSLIKPYVIVLATCFLLIFGFLIHFPVKKSTIALVDRMLAQLPMRITYQKIDTNLFWLPTLTLSHLMVDEQYHIAKLEVQFRGLSVVPFGPKAKITITLPNNLIELYAIPSFGKIAIKWDEQKLNFASLNNEMNLMPLKIDGRLQSTALIEVNFRKQIENINFMILSQDLLLVSQNINGFQIPELNLGNFSLKIRSSENQIQVNELLLGSVQSPLIAQFKGTLSPQYNTPSNSNLELKGKIKFGEKIIKTIPILPFFLKKYRQENGFYQIGLSGPLSHPTPYVL